MAVLFRQVLTSFHDAVFRRGYYAPDGALRQFGSG